MKKIQLILLLHILIISCNNKERNLICKNEYYQSGIIKERYIYDNDILINKTEFYKTGDVKNNYFYINNKLKFTQKYFKNGKIHKYLFCKKEKVNLVQIFHKKKQGLKVVYRCENGIPNGITNFFHAKGYLDTKVLYKNNTLIGDIIKYAKDGKLKTYVRYTDSGIKRYIRDYKYGKYDSSVGNLIYIKDTLINKDSIKLKLDLVFPADCSSTDIIVEQKLKSGKKIFFKKIKNSITPLVELKLVKDSKITIMGCIFGSRYGWKDFHHLECNDFIKK